jgi:2-desacetyl-2-hydroxyethyl bacteriochlorophyllide A dehydrogenase
MRALVCSAAGEAAVMDVPRAGARDGEVEIAVEAAGICGLDAAAFAGRSRMTALPAVLGHELVGRLADGQRVVVNPFIACGRCAPCRRGAANLCAEWRMLGAHGMQGGFAERVCVPEGQVCGIPETVTDARAVLAEPLANVVHMMRMVGMDAGARVGIVGAGLMGALCLQVVRRAGAGDVMVVESVLARRAAAMRMGAAAAWDGADEALRSAGEGFDLVVDACGSGEARELALMLCRSGGVAALMGMAERRSAVDWNAAIRRELRVQTAFGFTPEDFAGAVAMLAAGEIELDAWTEEWAMEDGQRALESACGARGGVLKRVLRVGRA